MGLGSLLGISILSSSAQLFGPGHIHPEIPGTAALEAAIPFGKWGLILALLGMFFAVAGAAVGITVGEIMIETQPTETVVDREQYRIVFAGHF